MLTISRSIWALLAFAAVVPSGDAQLLYSFRVPAWPHGRELLGESSIKATENAIRAVDPSTVQRISVRPACQPQNCPIVQGSIRFRLASRLPAFGSAVVNVRAIPWIDSLPVPPMMGPTVVAVRLLSRAMHRNHRPSGKNLSPFSSTYTQ